ncbi:DgyrCDS3949 [Dimorphilus gyrociliatus]|uniref:DgyrCDS3949 n=1 Tax=Dimorphilus gyrociliatus TaxID=2664684 RepID=A0A7I8VGX6_9ANNE|nr:DgyrCDS3949 [Dimorphilus gyrociliatus]
MSQPGKKLRVVPQSSILDINSFDIPFKGPTASSPFRKGSQIVMKGDSKEDLRHKSFEELSNTHGKNLSQDSSYISGSKKNSQPTQNYLKEAMKPIEKYTLFQDTQDDSLVDTIIDNSLEESFNAELTVTDSKYLNSQTYDPNDSSQSLFSSEETVLSSSQVESYDESNIQGKSSTDNKNCNLLSKDYNSKHLAKKIDSLSKINTLPINSLPKREEDSIIKRPAISGARKHWKILDKRTTKKNSAEKEFSMKEFSDTQFFGLPEKIGKSYKQIKKINDLYDWQKECLNRPSVIERKNLVYSLPTSGGKTLVAEILMLKELLMRKKNALFILPYVALVQEKVKAFSNLSLEFNFSVEEYASAKGKIPPRKKRTRSSLFIATIEKANILINSLLETGREDELGIVVIDELHMLGEQGRGAILEGLITKLIVRCSDTFIVGMSATIDNIFELGDFLRAEVYTKDFRPVKLTEKILYKSTLYKVSPLNNSTTQEKYLGSDQTENERKFDPDGITQLVKEVIPEKSCLIFCPIKKNCESIIILLSKLLPKSLLDVKKHEKANLLKELQTENERLCDVLAKTVPFGIAYHHSGLTQDERRTIEDGFLSGTLCLLACTSTLAAGINLPAARVIIRAPKIAGLPLSKNQYKQMIGRAGRAGLDSEGDSVLVCEKKEDAIRLLNDPCERCLSSLTNPQHLHNFVLSLIALKVAINRVTLNKITKHTLAFIQKESLNENIQELSDIILKNLIDENLIIEKNDVFEITVLGKACFKGCIDSKKGGQLHAELYENLDFLTLRQTHLHLLYLVTPLDSPTMIKTNWKEYFNELNRLTDRDLKLVSQIGVSEAYVARKSAGINCKDPANLYKVEKFFATLVLHNLWNCNSIYKTSEKFGIPRGTVQNLMTTTASYASCVNMFCGEFEEFWPYVKLFEPVLKRLSTHCVHPDVMQLMEVPGVKLGRTKQLFAAGYTSIRNIALAKPLELIEKIDNLSAKTAGLLVTTAKMILNDQVETLKEEVEFLLSP